jgi:flagellar motor switch protein FliN/FliY
MADDNLDLSELEESAPAAPENGIAAQDDQLPEIPDVPHSAQDLEAVYDIPVQVSAVLGKSTMEVQKLLKLGRGAVV